MNSSRRAVTLLDIPLVRETYGRSCLASVAIHVAAVLVALFGARWLPQGTIQLGGGPGGGIGGEISTVGVVETLSGGAGMVKPSLVPQPPPLPKEAPSRPEKAIPLPGTTEAPKRKPAVATPAPAPETMGNIIPTAPEPGSGGIAAAGGGSGGGSGGGTGVSIGTGSGGFGDSYYALGVEKRISDRWIRPPAGLRVQIVCSFFIAANGAIYNVKLDKSSGNQQMDLMALRAINSANPLSPPPLEYRGKAIQFVAQFIYPPVP